MKLLKRIVFGVIIVLSCAVGVVYAEEKWKGIDESVVQKIAREHGRETREPLINTGEGDLQLFVFLAAGAVGGFVAGYCWRMLTEGKKETGQRRRNSLILLPLKADNYLLQSW